VPELLEQARKRAEQLPNVTFVEGDSTKLPFEYGSFDLAGTLRTLHHIARPELAMAELVRVTRPRGRVLVIDQIAPVDPLAAAELNRFERARDPSHSRALADVDLRGLFESNGLVLIRAEYEREPRELDAYLDLAGCEGEAREQAENLAPPGYTADLGRFLHEKRKLKRPHVHPKSSSRGRALPLCRGARCRSSRSETAAGRAAPAGPRPSRRSRPQLRPARAQSRNAERTSPSSGKRPVSRFE